MKTKEKFIKYEALLQEWSKRMNLVAPSTLDDVENRHFKDSLQLLDFLPPDGDIVDLGSGAGFPGVVLAIMGRNVTCVESTGKKVLFLKELKKELDLPNLRIYHGRLESIMRKLCNQRVIFTARAFAPLVKIFDYVYPTKSRLFLLKGRGIQDEILKAKQVYDFDYVLHESSTGDGFVTCVQNISKIHMK